MKKILLLIVAVLAVCLLHAQKDCGTPAPPAPPKHTPEQMQRIAEARTQYTTPYPLRVFIRVFANDDGTNLAATEDNVLRQFRNMRDFYSAHNICFILSGYEVINNSDLNNMNKDETNDRDQIEAMALTNSLTIFVHASLMDNDGGLNGTAYGIPNHFFSLVGSAVSSTTNLTTMAHEMGHCLGLLHTFEDAYGVENVARSGNCKDCDGDGDLLCDTQADRNVGSASINSSCNYTGSLQDECGSMIPMEETNVMTYGRRECRDHFSNGQGARARDYLISDHENRIAENTIVVGNANITTALHNYAARNTITFSATSYIVSSAASANFSSRAITFTPGVELKPQLGYVVARVGTYCQ